MTEKFFVDTNIVFYAVDNDGSARHHLARQLLDGLPPDRFYISTQVLLELANILRNKIGLKGEDLIAAVDFRTSARVMGTTPDDVLDAVRLTQSAGISIWDAMIVTAAAKARCSVLYTEDLNHHQIISGVRVVNPFKEKESQ